MLQPCGVITESTAVKLILDWDDCCTYINITHWVLCGMYYDSPQLLGRWSVRCGWRIQSASCRLLTGKSQTPASSAESWRASRFWGYIRHPSAHATCQKVKQLLQRFGSDCDWLNTWAYKVLCSGGRFCVLPQYDLGRCLPVSLGDSSQSRIL